MVLLSNMSTGAERCDVGLGSIMPTSERYQMGVRFSTTHYHTGMAIMLPVFPPAPFYKWGFLRPFDWTMWLALGLTLLFMPGIVWYVERLNVHGSIPLSWSSVQEWKTAAYTTLLACFNIQVYDVTTLPAQIVVIIYLFLILITVATYTANLASVFTIDGSNSALVVTAWSDLVNQPVLAQHIELPKLQSFYGLNQLVALNQAEDDYQQLATAKTAMLNGSYVAFVGNLELIQGFLSAGYNNDCSLSLTQFDEMEPAENFAFAFRYDFPLPLVSINVSLAVAQAEESGELYALHEQYLLYNNMCPATSTVDSVQFYELSGLWILLAAALGFALCWSVVMVVVLARRHMRDIFYQRSMESELGASPRASAHSTANIMSEAMSRVFVTRAQVSPAPSFSNPRPCADFGNRSTSQPRVEWDNLHNEVSQHSFGTTSASTPATLHRVASADKVPKLHTIASFSSPSAKAPSSIERETGNSSV